MRLIPIALAILAPSAAAAPPLPPSTVTVELGKGQTAKVTRRAGDTSATVLITVNKSAVVKVLQPVVMHGGLNADLSAVTAAMLDAGSAELRVRPTTEQASAGDHGAFRTVCGLAAYAFNDPIVYPGDPGRSHLHAFFGNTGIDANSTAESLRTTGNSTCRGGIINRSAYWVSALLDTRTSRPVQASLFQVYYKDGEFNTLARDFQPGVVFQDMPAGLRMIAGDPSASAPVLPGADFTMRWKCIGTASTPPAFGSSIPNCPAGTKVYQEVFFPQCWDGKNLDSPDHKSHMSYRVLVRNAGDPRGWSHAECPATHPVVLPQVAYEIAYDVTEAGAPQYWRLASDSYDPAKPGGYSSHGDWFGAWLEQPWRKNCVSANKDCHSHLLGDGREMF